MLLIGDELAEIVNSRYGSIDFEWGIAGASTDFVGSLYERGFGPSADKATF